MEHFTPAVTEVPQVLVSAKSVELVPVRETLLMESAALPVLVSVTVCAALVVPTSVVKVSGPVAESETTGAGAAVPVPVRVTDCGEPAALSASETDAVKVAADAGVKVIAIEHIAPAATDVPQVLVSAKSVELGPVMETLLMESAALPVLVSVTVCAALVEPTCAVKVSGPVAERETTGAGVTVPVPLRVTDCGEPAALSVRETDAAKVVAEAGVKVTDMAHLAPAARDLPHVFVCAKSLGLVPVMEMLPMESAALPVLVSVTACAALVAPTAAVNVSGPVVFSETTGSGVAVPVPFSVIDCGEAAASSVSESTAVKPATDAGVNVTEIAHLALTASDAPQVLVCAKSVGFVPAIFMLLMVSAALPVLVSVTVCAALVEPTAAVNVSGPVVLRETTGAGAAVTVAVTAADFTIEPDVPVIVME
jgi:hypothetical protein